MTKNDFYWRREDILVDFEIGVISEETLGKRLRALDKQYEKEKEDPIKDEEETSNFSEVPYYGMT